MAYKLVKHTRTAAGYFYIGEAEQGTFDVTLPPEQLPGISFFSDKITDALVQAAAGEGTVLDTKVYFDEASWYNCNYRVIATVHASPFAWAPVIIAALVVIGIGIVAWILHDVQSAPYLGIGLVAVGVGLGALGIGYLVKTVKT